MIINHTHRFIFLHVPKNAGTSITAWLSGFTGWNDIELGGTDYGEQIQNIYGPRFKLYKHATAAQIRRIIGDEFWDMYFTFAVVRHPLDRLVSAYHFYCQWNHPSTDPVRAFSGFDEFIFSDYFKEDRMNPTRPTGSQTQFLGIGGEHPIDMLCRFEDLTDGLRLAAKRIGIPRPKLSRVNESKRGNYRNYYTRELLDIVIPAYREDFIALGYELPQGY